MRAILIATGVVENGGPLNERIPSVLLPLVDRPFIQHVVEYVVALGIDEIHFVLSHLPDQIETFLGSGDRWGAKFHFHLCHDPYRPYEILRDIDLSAVEEAVLIGHADRLPAISGFTAGSQGPAGNQLYDAPSQNKTGKTTWSGWARLHASRIPALAQAANESDLETGLLASDAERRSVATSLDARTYRSLLESQKLVLANRFPGLLSTGRESEPGIRRAGTAEVHPGARLIAPVFLGEHCRIMEGAAVGPYAVVSADAVLDRGCAVANSVICRGTYVGQDLELAEVIAEKDCLTNVRLGAALRLTDAFLLGSIFRQPAGAFFATITARCFAFILLVLLSPVLIATALWLWISRGKPVGRCLPVVKLPAGSEPASWRDFGLWSFTAASGASLRPRRHFIFSFLPALFNAAKGDLDLVGLPPRSARELLELPAEWRGLYVAGRVGIVTEEISRYGGSAQEEERYGAELFHFAPKSPLYDLSLLGVYFMRVMQDCFTRGPVVSPAEHALRAGNRRDKAETLVRQASRR